MRPRQMLRALADLDRLQIRRPYTDHVRELDKPGVAGVCCLMTPEVYFGYSRGYVANPYGHADVQSLSRQQVG